MNKNTNKNTAPLSATQRAALESLQRGKVRPIRVVFAIALALACGACGVRPAADTTPAPAPAPAVTLADTLAQCYAAGYESAVFAPPAEYPCADAYAIGAYHATDGLADAADDPIYNAYDGALAAADGVALEWCIDAGHCEGF